MRKLTVMLFLTLACSLSVLAFEEHFERSFPLSPGGTFEIANVNGSVLVEGWPRDFVQIQATKRAQLNPQDIARVKIHIHADPQRVAVETIYPQDAGTEVSVEYRIRVPQRVLLRRVHTVNGNVRIAGVEGTGDLGSVNGNIELFDGVGGFDAHTTNGSIQMEYRYFDVSRSVALETVNGLIVVVLPADASVDLDVRSMNGDFLSELPLNLRGQALSRDFRARIGRGGPTLKLRTVNGGIRVVTAQPAV